MLLTFGMVKATCGKELSVNSAIPSGIAVIVEALNEVQPRLMDMGKWKGTFQAYRFCVNSGCITLPREVDGIEAFAIEGQPGTVRNQWFEFLESGPGLLDPSDSCIGVQLVDRGLNCAFDDVVGTDKKLAVYSEKTESATAKIVLRFYDKNGNFVRTQQNGIWEDGELITLPAAGAYAYTTSECMPNGLVSVIKPITNGTIRLYEYNNITAALKPLAYYAPTEKTPEYRRALIPNLAGLGCGGSCENTTVDVMAKLQHIPITGKDNDMLIIRSLGALKLGCKAFKHESSNDFEGAAIAWGAAKNTLDQQLRTFLGDGAVQPVRFPSPEIFGGAVQNVI